MPHLDPQRDFRSYETWLDEQAHVIHADLALKHARMAESPWAFFRGAFPLWARQWPKACAPLLGAPRVLAVGDVHLENFGTWRDDAGRLVWGLNDLDEAYPLPYTFDLVRLATSALLTLPLDRAPGGASGMCAAVLDGYRAALPCPTVSLVEVQPFLVGLMRSCLVAQRRRWLNPPDERELDDVPTGVRAALTRRIPDSSGQLQFFARRAGLGSLGRRRIVARGTVQGRRFAWEAKRLVPSGAAWSSGDTSGQLFVQDALRAAQPGRMPDVSVEDHYLVRQLAPDCAKVDLDLVSLTKVDTREWLALAAGQLALVHARDRVCSVLDVQNDLDARPNGWLSEAALVMAAMIRGAWHAYAASPSH
jgi:Uncharacterized protein conserved in bacteria (DUF2252)